jgi:succinyl-diaminopimelate desuccinylase
MSIMSRAKGYQDELVSFTSQLVRIPTVNPPGARYSDIVAILEKKCRSLGLKTRRIVVPKNECKSAKADPRHPRVCLLAEWDTGSKRWLHINGHFDVVPVTSFWKTDPFKPVLRNGKLYGRGTADMKSDIAASLYAVKILKDEGIVPKANIQFSFVPDEETGATLGMRYLVKQGLIKADAIIGEGHSKSEVSIGNKGVFWLRVEVIGKASHAAYSYRGVNAFRYAAQLAVELDKLRAVVERRTSRYAFSAPQQRHPTLVVGGFLSGGAKTNTVPDRVIFSIDRRILPDEDKARAKKEILNVIDGFRLTHPQVRIKTSVEGGDSPVVVDTADPFLRLFSRMVRKVTGTRTRFKVLCGGTDLRFLLYRGIPGVGYSPDGENMHSDNEFVRVESIVKTTAVFAHVMAGMQALQRKRIKSN